MNINSTNQEKYGTPHIILPPLVWIRKNKIGFTYFFEFIFGEYFIFIFVGVPL
jgi:hypothetical protein